jgi:hypothetical protein
MKHFLSAFGWEKVKRLNEEGFSFLKSGGIWLRCIMQTVSESNADFNRAGIQSQNQMKAAHEDEPAVELLMRRAETALTGTWSRSGGTDATNAMSSRLIKKCSPHPLWYELR